MEDSIECPWNKCQFIFPDQIQLDFHVMLNHCEYGRVISHYYHNCNRNLSALIQTGTGNADKRHDCEFGTCKMEFDNELQMNVHVMELHVEHIIPLEQTYTQMNQVLMVPNDVKPLILTPFQPSDDTVIQTGTITLDDDSENSNDSCSVDQPRKTYKLRQKRILVESQDDNSSDSDSDKSEKKDDEEVMEENKSQCSDENIPESQSSIIDSQNIIVDPEECENLKTTMIDYPNLPVKKRPYFFKIKNNRRTEFHCLFAECEEKRYTQKKIENHFRSVHLKISKEMEGFVHAKRTEENRYDELVNQGLICK